MRVTPLEFTRIPLASYGSLARFKDMQRLHAVGQNTIIGAGGDMSDFQYIQRTLDQLIIDEFAAQDNHSLGPSEVHAYLGQMMYARRSKMNPLWNALLVGGVKEGERYLISCVAILLIFIIGLRFLAFVDLLGTTYSASTLATGFGAYIAQPILRNEVEGREDTLTEDEALHVLEKCMRVLFYRDARSLNKVFITLCAFINSLPPISSIK